MTEPHIDLQITWEAIRSAGGRDAYIERVLKEKGLYVERRPSEEMSANELKEYKKKRKLEAKAREQLRKDSWKVYHAHHIVYLGEGIFWNEETDFDRFDHPDAEQRLQQNNLPHYKNPQALADALKIDIPQLRWLTFHRNAATDVHYEHFTIPKRDGSPRLIWAPKPLLKRCQQFLLREIFERLPIHGSAHGFVPQRSIYTNALQHTDAKLIVKLDLKDFFPSITFQRTKGLLRSAGYQEQIATLIALLCTEAPRQIVEFNQQTHYVSLGPRCLPQGAPTSPAITNAICMRLDRRLAVLSERFGWRYSRYADDLTFSVPNQTDDTQDTHVGKLITTVRKIAQEEGFSVHSKKTRILRASQRQKVTGMIVNGPGTPRVPRETRRLLRAVIHRLQQGQDFFPDEDIHTWLGYAAYVAMTDREKGIAAIQQLSQIPAAD